MPNGSEANGWCVEFKVNKGLMQGSAFKWPVLNSVWESQNLSALLELFCDSDAFPGDPRIKSCTVEMSLRGIIIIKKVMQVSTAVNICLERGEFQNSLENKKNKKTRG